MLGMNVSPREISLRGRIFLVKRWLFVLGVLISILLMYFALRGLRLQEAWTVIREAKFLWLVPGVTVYFIGVWVRAWRWHYLLRPLKAIPTRRMFPPVAIGYWGNNVLPARAGELLRAVVLKAEEDVPVSASLATVITERIFDGVVMLAFVFLNLRELARLTDDSGYIGSIQNLAIWGSAAFLGALAIFLLAAMFPQRAHSVGKFFIDRLLPSKWQGKLLGILQRFLDGLESLRSPRDVLMIFFTSVIIWLLETGKYWFVMHAFSFEVSFFALMLMNGIVNLATTIPSAPGYIGTFDAPGIALLQAYGISKEIATGYTLLLHVALWLPITVVGFIYFLRFGAKLGTYSYQEIIQEGLQGENKEES
jgi:glycosyltransferase 2 family protein